MSEVASWFYSKFGNSTLKCLWVFFCYMLLVLFLVYIGFLFMYWLYLNECQMVGLKIYF